MTVEQFQAARAIVDIAATTAHYNLTNRLGGQLRAAAENAGVMFSPWHPATIDGDDTRAAVAKIAKRHHATPKQVALAWHLHSSPFSVPIPGTTSIDHFGENLAAAHVQLSPDEVESLTALRPPPKHQLTDQEDQRS